MSDKVNVRRMAVSGLAAGGAYLATTWADSKLSSHPFNDVKLIGQMFTTRPPLWIVLGTAGHFGFSLLVALTYARYFHKRLPGPPVLKGVTFLQIENTLLYPAAIIVDRVHAGIRAGELPPMMNRKTFQGQVLRHLSFGAVLGALYRAED